MTHEAVYKTPFRNVIIPLHKGNIGISYSGGADCAILLYALVLNGVVPTTLFYVNTKEPVLLFKGLAFIDDEFGTDLVNRVKRIEMADRKGRYDLYRKIAGCDFLYTGVTQNPSVKVSEWKFTPQRPHTAMVGRYEGLVTPFGTHDKRAPMYLYHYLDALPLLELTRTCPLPEDQEPCGKCFHCGERAWAEAEVKAVL